jgi:small subunit ribosomal protein S6
MSGGFAASPSFGSAGSSGCGPSSTASTLAIGCAVSGASGASLDLLPFRSRIDVLLRAALRCRGFTSRPRRRGLGFGDFLFSGFPGLDPGAVLAGRTAGAFRPTAGSSAGPRSPPPVAITTAAVSTKASHATFPQRTRPIQSTPRQADRRAASPRPGLISAANLPRSMTRLYDLMLLIDPNAPEERRNAAISEAESMIASGGELVESHDWGTRRMAYEIDHRPEADYRLYLFRGDNALLERLNQRLRILDAVLRFRIIKQKPGAPTPPPPEQQSARRREDREPQDTRVAARAAADAPPI